MASIGVSHSSNSLDFSQSDLTEVPPCPADQTIDAINLDRNNIQELFSHSFDNYDHLTQISVAFNGLRNIHDGTFDNIRNLQKLDLHENSIVKLPTNFGPSTVTLFEIDLTAAIEDLRLLSYPYFSAFTSLSIITIGSINNENLNDSFFPPNLQLLVSNKGRLDTFPPLSSLTKIIRSVSFTEHQITTITQEAVSGLFELYELHLDFNNITNFPNFSHCTKLSKLFFVQNQLSYIPRQHIEGLESIQEIDFAGNYLTHMPDISHLISLQKISVGYNFITNIPIQFIEGLPNMTTFDCNNNELTSLPNISTFFPGLKELYVQQNHLKILPDMYEFSSLVKLNAAENPYKCNASMCWLRMLPWLKPPANVLQDNPKCDLPAPNPDPLVIRFHPTAMGCYNGGSLGSRNDLTIVLTKFSINYRHSFSSNLI